MTTEQLNAIKQRLSERKPTTDLSIEGVCIAVMEVHQIQWEYIVRKSNIQHNVKCREQLAYLLYNYASEANYHTIANLLNRDHSTIIHNVKNARMYVDVYPLYKKQVETILEKAKQWQNEQQLTATFGRK